MPELHIRMKDGGLLPPVESALETFAESFALEIAPVEAGYLLLPDVMLRKYGIFLFPMERGYRVCREEDATSWEDFLMMHLAHHLSDQFGAELYVEDRDEIIEVAPHKFATFDHYVETVVEKDNELVRDMKKYWLYAHRKRSLR